MDKIVSWDYDVVSNLLDGAVLKKSMKIRLSAMMYMQCFVLGATVPIMSIYLRDYLHFTGLQTGTILAVSALSAFISPLVGSVIADRFLSAEKFLAVGHLCSAILMFVLLRQTDFTPVLWIYFSYCMMQVIANALTNAIIFHHTTQASRNFGGIRMWGTIGWISVAWFFSYVWLGGGSWNDASGLPDVFKVSAIASIICAAYVLTLPKSPGMTDKIKSFIPLESIRVVCQPRILFICLLFFLMSFAHRYYYVGMAPFMRQLGFRDANIMPLMSMGQLAEIFAMAGVGILLFRFGFKKVIMFGILMDVFRFTSFAIGGSNALIISGNTCHGLAYTFCLISALIYLDSHCDKDSRTAVHQLILLINAGFASFFGSFAAGQMMDIFASRQSGLVNYRAFWMIPTVVVCICFFLVLAFFREPQADVVS